MKENKGSIESLFEETIEYGKNNYELFKLKTIDKISDSLSSIVPLFIILILLGLFMIFINIGLSFWVGELLGEIYYGFLVVGGFYGLISIVFCIFFNKKIKRAFYDYFVRKIIKSNMKK